MTDDWDPAAHKLECSVCHKDIAAAGVSIDGVFYCPEHAPGRWPQQQALDLTS